MTVAAELLVRVGADTGAATREIASFRGGLENAAASMGRTGLALSAGITAPLVGAATAALKFSTDLNSAMANVASLNIASDRVIELKNDVQEMAIATGKGTGDLADGLYQVISAFGDSADTAEILRINAVAAAAGLATTTDAINLTSAVTKGYGDTSAEAIQHVSDLAFKTVEMGQTTFPELANAMGKVVPLAAELGVSQEELFAVMATGTGVTGSASEVVTQMRGSLQALMAPTADMTRLYSSLGFSSGQAMLQQLGYAETMSVITQHARDTDIPLQKFMGSIEGQTLALALSGAQADTFVEKLAAMGDVTGAVDAAFLAQTDGINAAGFAYQQAMIQVQVLAERLGDALAPAFLVVLGAIEPLIDMLSNVVTWFSEADNSTQMAILAFLGIAAAAGPVLLALSGMAAGLAFLLSPIGLVVAGAAALGAAWVADFLGMRTATLNFIESVRGLVGVFQDARARGLNPFEAALLTVQTALDNLGLQGASTALGNFAAATQEAWRRAVDFASNLDNWPGPLRGIAAAIGAGVTALGEFVSHVREVIASSATLRGALVTLGRQGFDFLSARVAALVSSAQARLEPLEAAFERISTIIAGIAAGDIEPAKEALRDAFSAISDFDMNAFISTLSSAGVDVSNAILNSFQRVDLPALRDTIIARLGLENFQLFPDGLDTSLDWSAVSVNTTALVSEVQAQMASIDFGAAASALSARARIAFAGIQWESVAPIDVSPLVQGIQRGFETAQQQLSAALAGDNPLSRFFVRVRAVADDIAEQMSGFGSAPIADRFARVVSSVLATVGLIGDTRFDLIQTATRHLSSLTTSLLEFGAGVVEGLDAEKIAAVLGGVATEWSSQFSAVFEGADLFDMASAAGSLGAAFVNKLSEILGAPSFGEDVGAAVGNMTVALTQAAEQVVTGIVGGISDTDWNQFAASFGTFTTGFIDGLSGSLAEANYGAIAQAIVDGVASWLAQQWQLGLGAPMAQFESGERPDLSAGPGAEFGRQLRENIAAAFAESSAAAEASMAEFNWPEIPEIIWPELPTVEWPTFEWPELPTVEWPTFEWPELPTVEWPTFEWPEFPAWTWDELPTWTWPEMPTVEWPTFPEFTWPEAATLWDWEFPLPQGLLLWQWPAPNDLLLWTFPEPASLIAWEFPSPEQLLGWAFPSPIDLLGWTWPSPTALLSWTWPLPSALLNWQFPSPSALLSWGWPRLPTWVWPSIPTPGWVTALLNLGRTGISIFGGGGGGGGEGPEAWDGNPDPSSRRWLPESSPGNTVHAANFNMAGAGGNGITVEINGPITIANDMDIEQVALEVARRIQQHTRR